MQYMDAWWSRLLIVLGIYFDDLIVVKKDPDHLFDLIWGKGFTIKETYAQEYFLGGNFERVKEPKSNNQILAWSTNTCVKRMIDNFKITFIFEPNKQHAAMHDIYKHEIGIADL